ncbi:MAG: hypothetical protein KJ697_00175 [Nanoarchaeota archaeon]|nr:hypothetical protein [Nanoarchaeota archaeon]
MSHAENKIKWCLSKAEKEIKEGKTHRGLLKTEPDINKAREHIMKAEHNLKATLYLQKGGYTDWCSSTLFYTMYHCFLSIIAKFGYESRNQECTFALIESLIEDGSIDIEKEDMDKITILDIEERHEEPTAVNIREMYQYTTKLSLEDKILSELLDLAKKILDKTKVIIEK